MKKILCLGIFCLCLGMVSVSVFAATTPTPAKPPTEKEKLAEASKALKETLKATTDAANKYKKESTDLSAAHANTERIKSDLRNLEERRQKAERAYAKTGATDAEKASAKAEADRLSTEISIKTKAKNDSLAGVGAEQQKAVKAYEELKKQQIEASNAVKDNEDDQNAATLKENLNSMVDASGSFDTDSFLSIANEKNLNIDSGDGSENNILNRILRYIVQLVGTFGVAMMVIAGFFMVTSEGDENRLQKGKNIFLYTIIGLLVAFMSYALVQFVLSVLFS